MNGLSYDYESLTNAMYCLLKMQELEDKKDFGKIKNEYQSKRYTAPVYRNNIDCTFYTDMATSTLGYTIWYIRNISENSDWFPDDMEHLLARYYDDGSHDLVNDSEGEYADFEGDMNIFDADIFTYEALYAYYNEFELVTGDKIVEELGAADDVPRIILRKKEDINGEKISFYYIGYNFWDIGEQLIQHDYNTHFLEERIPGEVLDLIKEHYVSHHIITVGEVYYAENNFDKQIDGITWAGIAYSHPQEGYIGVKGDYFTEVICHEYGHLFDYYNVKWIGDSDYYITQDYKKSNSGTWDLLTKEYADEIYTIRKGADIGCGYDVEGMLDDHNEFYAEAFQLYFYSEETRAALPKEVREQIEKELKRDAGIEMED